MSSGSGVAAGDDGGDGIHDVYAAGGIVADGAGRLLVVHRPRYDDWTLPKGKLEPGETMAECALREVAEETGYTCRLGDEASSVEYLDQKSRKKLVRYWHMTVRSGSFVANDEVDEIRWLPLGDALALLSYARDTQVLLAR